MITLEERKKIREVYANVDLTPKNGYLISPYLGKEIERMCQANSEPIPDITDFSLCLVCEKEKAPIETGVCKKCSKKVRRP